MRLLAVPAVALLLGGCAGPSMEAADVADAVGTTFAHLYVRAQEQQGRTDVTAEGLVTATTCTRGGGDTLDRGPGDDWSCVVSLRDPSLGPRQVRYEVTLKPEGCFTADGPPAVVGDARITDVDGELRLNPVYAFDGCL